MLLIVVLGFVINLTWNSRAGVLGIMTDDLSPSSLLADTNAQRTGAGDQALALNNQLSAAAQQKANDMVARNYWSHTTPDGKQPWQFIGAAGYKYQVAGENLAYGFATGSDTVLAWMHSPTHRANVLNSAYTDVGFGIAHAASYQGNTDETVVVAMYAAPSTMATSATNVSLNNSPTAVLGEQTGNQPVTRLDAFTNGNGQIVAVVGAVIVALLAFSLVYRHGKQWRKYLVRGERFVIRHPVMDTFVVTITVISITLIHVTGFIQ